jgi:general secretion pathway protein G
VGRSLTCPKDIPLDPWGHEYRYESPGQNGDFDIVSTALDGKEGGEEKTRTSRTGRD